MSEFNWQKEYAIRREKQQRDCLARRKVFMQKIPALRTLHDEYIALQKNMAMQKIQGDHACVEQSLQKIDLLEQERASLLEKAGFSNAAWQLHYDCEKCQDYGLIDNKDCDCLKALKAERCSQTAEWALFQSQNFEHFDIEKFPEENGQRERMLRARQIAEDYAERFPQNTPRHLFFLGSPGLGKSYLLHCIGQRVQQQGKTVKMLTGYQFHQLMIQNIFNSTQSNPYGNLLQCDLLIIDDLGTEPVTNKQMTESNFFALLDERILLQRPMLLASNYTLDELRSRYGERTTSRLLDKNLFHGIALKGEDIRIRRIERK